MCWILGAFGNLRKATIRFLMSIHLSIRPHRKTRLIVYGFPWNFVLVSFMKNCREKLFHWNRIRVTDTLHVELYIFWNMSYSILFRMRNISIEICRRNQNTHFAFINYFFENRAVYEIMWGGYCRAEEATDENIAHAHCKLDTLAYKHTLRTGNSNCFSTTTIFSHKRFIVVLYEYCLSYF